MGSPLAGNVVLFGRVLRAAGIETDPGRMAELRGAVALRLEELLADLPSLDVRRPSRRSTRPGRAA